MKKKLFFVSLEHWDDIWRRNQFFADRMRVDYEVFYIQPVLPITSVFSSKKKGYKDIKLINIYKLFPEKLKIFNWLNQLFYILQIIFKVGKNINVLWINDHMKYFLAKSIENKKLIYDITDDWLLAKTSPKEKKKIIYADSFLCKKADKVIVCSKHLLESRKKITDSVVLIKNGVDIDFYQTDNVINLGLKKPILMYTGTFHEERVDVPLLLYLADRFTNCSFVFIGPVFLSKEVRIMLEELENIILMGAVPYKDIPMYQNSADVLIVPHLVTEFTMSLDPIKQYEYLCSDKPVISTVVSGFVDHKEVFSIPQNKEEFAQYIKNYIEDSLKVNVNSRLEEAKKNSWDQRYKHVREVLNNLDVI